MKDDNYVPDANFETGAVRSADVDHLDFASMPLVGLIGVLKIAGCGGIKYGRHNYAKGMPVHVTLNHVAYHLIRYLIGDRTEDHLSKVAWGAMVANQTAALQPELAEPHLPGPGFTLTPALLAEMARGDEERSAKRQAKQFEELFHWTLANMPEVQEIIRQRGGVVAVKPGFAEPQGRQPTRVETDHGCPNPRPGETWVEYTDGTRAYFLLQRPSTDQCPHLDFDCHTKKCGSCGATKAMILLQSQNGTIPR